MKSFILTSALISFAIISLNSCKKEEPVPGGNATSCEVISSDIVTTTTLTNRVSDPNIADYCITEFISVKEGAGLIIEPGVVIEFSNGAGIEVGTYGSATANAGYIIADGIPADKITFTGASKTPGSWRGIAISPTNTDSRNELDNCIIEYAGGQELKSWNSGFGLKTAVGVGHTTANQTGLISITNCTIQNNDGKGYSCRRGSGLNNFFNNKFKNNAEEAVFMSANGFGKLDPLSTFTSNGFDGFYQSNLFTAIEQIADTIHTWRGYQGKYFLSVGVRLVYSTEELHIQQGTEVVMASGSLIHVRDGLFTAIGVGATGPQRVVFNAESTGVGTWKGIYLESTQDNKIINVDVYGGGSEINVGTNKANITVGYRFGKIGKGTITNCALRYSGGCGIYVRTTSPTQRGDLTESGNLYYGNVGGNVCN